MDIAELQRLAGITSFNKPGTDRILTVGDKSAQAAEKRAYEKQHNIKPGTAEWFKLWFARPQMTGENPMPKKV